MGLLQNGQWVDQWYDTKTTGGAFQRSTTRFREKIVPGGAFPPQGGRYHLYVSLACPWAHRTLIFRALKRLENVISVSFVEPLMLEQGWTFAAPDPLTGAKALHQVYVRADPQYSGRVTVPVLWDKQSNAIVNNESSEIIRILNTSFDDFTDVRHDYYPDALRGEIDAANARIYDAVNNGVYKAGFATLQAPYDAAVAELFAALDWVEELLSRRRYLAGGTLTEADIRLFTTIIRFDPVYHGHFKCNWRHAFSYSNLWRLTREIYNLPGVAATVDFDVIKTHYYGSHASINPTGIVPRGPVLDLSPPPNH